VTKENNTPSKNPQDIEEKDKVFNKINHKRQKTQINFTNSTLNVKGTTTVTESETNKEKIINIPIPNQYSTIVKDNNSSLNSSKSDESGALNTSSTSVISNVNINK
jgi:hypothetical protein